MYTAHYVAHSVPIVALFMLVSRFRYGAWPRWYFAWLLHILIDIPTHSRQQWAPQFLWPLSIHDRDDDDGAAGREEHLGA